MRQLALVLHTLMLAAAAACHSPARTTVTPENLIGTYRFERSGTNLGRSWSVRSTLTLESSKRYELENTIRNDDETNDEIELGVYYIDRRSIKLRSEKSETTELLVRGDSLVAKIDWPGRWFARFAQGLVECAAKSYDAGSPRPLTIFGERHASKEAQNSTQESSIKGSCVQ